MQPYAAALLHMYTMLAQGRQSSMNGYESMSWTDMQAWLSINGYCLTSFEIEAIRAMDISFLNAINKLTNARKI